MSITKFSMHQRRLVTVIAFMCALIGFFEYLHFPSQEDPQIESRVSVVSAFNPGLAPEEMEHLIARPIEEHARKLPEVDEIESRVRQGSATVEITFHDWATNLDPIYQKLRNYMEEAQREFQDGTVGAFVNDDCGKVSTPSIALTSPPASVTVNTSTSSGDMKERRIPPPRRLRSRSFLRRLAAAFVTNSSGGASSGAGAGAPAPRKELSRNGPSRNKPSRKEP